MLTYGDEKLIHLPFLTLCQHRVPCLNYFLCSFTIFFLDSTWPLLELLNDVLCVMKHVYLNLLCICFVFIQGEVLNRACVSTMGTSFPKMDAPHLRAQTWLVPCHNIKPLTANYYCIERLSRSFTF